MEESPRHPPLSPHLVMITADNKEVRRRIDAFIAHKRNELDMQNRIDFCPPTTGDTCARTRAVLNMRKDSKSHLKVTYVENPWGPQTHGLDPGSFMRVGQKQPKISEPFPSSSSSSSPRSESCPAKRLRVEESELPEGIEERLRNMEEHMNMPLQPGQPVPRDVYSRIKQLEDRLLYLEGLSPEYFTLVQQEKRTSQRHSHKRTLEDLDKRIETLQQQLQDENL